MSENAILSFAGETSQTGQAVLRRFEGYEIVPYNDFKEIGTLLKTKSEPIAVPVWNSHEGEIRTAGVWEHVIAGNARIGDLWPGRIEFWLVMRRSSLEQVKRVCSVKVARQQCSRLLTEMAVEFTECRSTVDAFKLFLSDSNFDAVLIPPDSQQLSEGLAIALKETANPNNFTAFALLRARNGEESDDGKNTSFTAVSMPAFRSELSDDQREFFERLFESINDLDAAPRLLFVFNRLEEEASIGLLFQGPTLTQSDLLSAEIIERDQIIVVGEAGRSAIRYALELNDFLEKQFPRMREGDFIKHRGDKTWLFACPVLGIYTHGYDDAVVEPAFRYYVGKVFSLLGDDLLCTAEQRRFFLKYESAWQERDTDFIEFTEIT